LVTTIRRDCGAHAYALDFRRVKRLSARYLGAREFGEEAADALEGRVIVVLRVDGEQFDQDIVFHLAAAGVTDAICEGAATLVFVSALRSMVDEYVVRLSRCGYRVR
jgi:hypothetical protein